MGVDSSRVRDPYAWLLQGLRDAQQRDLVSIIECEIRRESAERAAAENEPDRWFASGEQALIALRIMRLYMVEAPLCAGRVQELLGTQNIGLERPRDETSDEARSRGQIWELPSDGFATSSLLQLRMQFEEAERFVIRYFVETQRG
jgi:hypothetical protein